MGTRTVFACALSALTLSQPVLATVIHVPADYGSIAEGLAAAQYGDTVLVGPGTYEEHSLLLPSGVTLLSVEGPEATVIDAQGLGRVLMVEEWADETTRIEGFTITGGSVAGYGGGIRCVHAPARVMGNIIAGNTATTYGGGIACEECSATVESNTISGNSAGYGGAGISVWGEGYSPQIRGNVITGNESSGSGGGVDSWRCSPVIEDNEITSNEAYSRGGGVMCSEGSVVIRWNTIVSNGVWRDGGPGGGGICCASDYEGSVSIQGNIIANNTHWLGGAGGGLACERGNAWITGNTFSRNAHGIFLNAGALGEVVLDRNIISFDYGCGLTCYSGSATITCCDFYNECNFDDCEDMIGVDGNFSEDPLFCDPDNGNFTLDCSSPCVQGYGCGLIGALGVGCGASRVEPVTWSGIKAMYR